MGRGDTRTTKGKRMRYVVHVMCNVGITRSSQLTDIMV